MNRVTTSAAIGIAAAAVAATVLPAPSAAAATSTAGIVHLSAVTAAQLNVPAVASALKLSGDEGLVARSVVTDKDGTTHTRYDRTFKGLRVVGGDMIVTAKGGKVTGSIKNASGKIAVDSTSPKVAKSSAISKGAAKSKAKQTAAPTGELVIYAAGDTPRLAYEVLTEGVKADQTPSRALTYIDAQTGAVLSSSEQIAEGSGNGIYVGNVSIGTSGTSGNYSLKDAQGNYTTDLNQGTTGNGTTFTDADDVWGNGSNFSRQSAGVDAQYGAEKTYDYYNSVLGRAGIWNNGTGARSRVHYGNSYNNAFWDGTQMTYGDGTNNAKPLTELDVAAHEMSHGVTENTANLDYGRPDLGIYKESGGLNESTSDIFGAAVEFYAGNAKDVPDYTMGEMIDLRGNGTPLRYMDKPSKDGASLDCYSASSILVDPHYASGPLNHWFYLASEGSGAKTINGISYNSPTCNSGSVTGAGHNAIEKIWYRTLATKLTSSSGYKQAREGAITSAVELYGTGSAQCTAVEQAFNAITVPAGSATCGGSTGGGTPPPTTGNVVTNGDFEAGATGWTASSGAITNSSSRPAHGGSYKLWLGGNGKTSSEYAQQSISVPASGGTLTYWLRVDTAETTTSKAYDQATVSVGGTTLKSYSNLTTPKSSWVQQSVSLSAYAGKTVVLKFAATEDSSLQTSFVIDDVSVG